VTQTRRAVETGMQWVFREQLFEDYGIDAQIEAVDGESGARQAGRGADQNRSELLRVTRPWRRLVV
jgi:hypothetical protein